MATGIAVADTRLKQGPHPDPKGPRTRPPDPASWPVRRQVAFASEAMEAFRSCLRLRPGADIRESVLNDLSQYFELSPEECVRRCINWEEWSVQEWQSRRRDSGEALADFYHKTMSWAFDLLWYAYLQAEGFAYPVGVAIARSLPSLRGHPRHLDFGSGVGTTSQLFIALGYESDLSDVSTSLLAFARYRLERRSTRARFIDLNVDELEPNTYDVITAVDTLVHVPNVASTAMALHRALKPGGVLFANFDVRPRSPENAWHLYEDDLPLRWSLQRSGFEPEESLDGMVTRYRRVEPRGLAHALRGARDLAALRSPLRPLYRSARRAFRQLGESGHAG